MPKKKEFLKIRLLRLLKWRSRQHIKKTTGKTGIEQAADKVKAKVEKYKKTKVGKVVKKIHDKAKKGKDTNAYTTNIIPEKRLMYIFIWLFLYNIYDIWFFKDRQRS